jgi:hypothetical protein
MCVPFAAAHHSGVVLPAPFSFSPQIAGLDHGQVSEQRSAGDYDDHAGDELPLRPLSWPVRGPKSAMAKGLSRYAAAGAAIAVLRRKYSLTSSIAIGEAKKKGSMNIQSPSERGTVSKNGCRNGT